MAFDAQEAQATLSNYLKEELDNTMRNRPFWNKMQARSRIRFNVGGADLQWPVRRSIRGARPHNDTITPQFDTYNLFERATITFRGYWAGERLGRFQLQRNRGPQAFIDLMNDAKNRLGPDLMQSIQDDVFIDGGATGNEDKWEGFETFLGAQASQTGDSGRVRLPDDSYANITTDLAAYGGSWTNVSGETATYSWPNGTGRNPSFDFWAPLLVDTTSTAWGTNPSFGVFGLSQLTYGIQYAMRQPHATAVTMLDLILMTTADYFNFKNLYQGSERIISERTPVEKSVGYTLLNYDGVDIGMDFGVPASTIYGLMFNQIEYISPAPQMFEVLAPRPTIDESAMLFPAYAHGNFKYNPRGFVKWYPYT
jgi:hypothetical protein